MTKQEKHNNIQGKQFSRMYLFKVGGVVLAFILLFGLLVSCSQTATSTSTAATKTKASENVAPAGIKTLRLGVVTDMGSDVNLDDLNGLKILVDEDNKNGGISVGEDHYKIDLISYDGKSAQLSEVSAINRLVYEDKVNYVIASGASFSSTWVNVTEANKVIVMGIDRIGVCLTTDKHFFFDASTQNPEISAKIGWYCKNYADKIQEVVIAASNEQLGNIISGIASKIFKSFGANTTVVFFPANTSDFSAVGTKIASLEPGTILVFGRAGAADALTYQAVYQDGYRKAQFFVPQDYTADTLLNSAPPEVLEGFVDGMIATEVTPALNEDAQHFKDLWTAKYGKWTNPQVTVTPYTCLKAALQKAGTLDTGKVADIIANGLEWKDVKGDCKMISRPDLGNSRTVDSVRTYYLKKIHNGKAEYLATVDPNEALSYYRVVYPPLPPGATPTFMAPPIGPPPGGGPPPGNGPPPQ